MSGGIEEVFELEKIINKEDFWNILVNAHKKNSVIGCNIHVKLICFKYFNVDPNFIFVNKTKDKRQEQIWFRERFDFFLKNKNSTLRFS